MNMPVEGGLHYKVHYILIAVMVYAIMANYSCKKSDDNNPSRVPTFEDPVPYGHLGHGKLVFTRIGPLYDAYNCICVIDIDRQQGWSMDCGQVYAPAVSPNGDRIAYSKMTDTGKDIYIMDNDGKNQDHITELTMHEELVSWTFDATQIFFNYWDIYGTGSIKSFLYRQSPAPNSTDRVAIIEYSAFDTTILIMGAGQVSSSITGKLLVQFFGLRTYDADGSNMQLIFSDDSTSDHSTFSPKWSPDGNKIALGSYKMSSDMAIVVMNADGTNPDTLISLPVTGTDIWHNFSEVSLCWSPDGTKIAFSRPDGIQVGAHIYIINSDGTGLEQVTFETGVTDCELSWGR